MRVAGHGIGLDVPDGWEARIVRRDGAMPVLHLATFPLHERDGDFGAAATGRMRADDLFLALVEYQPGGSLRPGVGLYRRRGVPPAPAESALHPSTLQVTRAGQRGWQRFFTDAERPCCLYVVIGASGGRRLRELRSALGSLRLAPGATAPAG